MLKENLTIGLDQVPPLYISKPDSGLGYQCHHAFIKLGRKVLNKEQCESEKQFEVLYSFDKAIAQNRKITSEEWTAFLLTKEIKLATKIILCVPFFESKELNLAKNTQIFYMPPYLGFRDQGLFDYSLIFLKSKGFLPEPKDENELFAISLEEAAAQVVSLSFVRNDQMIPAVLEAPYISFNLIEWCRHFKELSLYQKHKKLLRWKLSKDFLKNSPRLSKNSTRPTRPLAADFLPNPSSSLKRFFQRLNECSQLAEHNEHFFAPAKSQPH